MRQPRPVPRPIRLAGRDPARPLDCALNKGRLCANQGSRPAKQSLAKTFSRSIEALAGFRPTEQENTP